VSLYDTAWILRGVEEFERLFKRKPFAGTNLEAIFPIVRESLRRYRRRAIIHFGEGRLNPSTVAWIIGQIEGEIGHRSAGGSA
jgi:hypothetical protein